MMYEELEEVFILDNIDCLSWVRTTSITPAYVLKAKTHPLCM